MDNKKRTILIIDDRLKYRPFAQKLAQLAANYEEEQILTFVTGYLTLEK